jgi:hypothetical protein
MGSEIINNSLKILVNWLNKKGWKGFDPYDIKAIPLLVKIIDWGNKNKIVSWIRELILEVLYIFPKQSRRLFNIKPQINPKAMGLFASSYLDLFIKTNIEIYKLKSEECLDWLHLNKIEVNNGIGWGYPFGWQSKEFIPANTPNGIVTTVVGEAFWDYYKYSGDKKYLNTCVGIANFLYSLPYEEYGKGICFSYTPVFINHVHNLNLFVAEFLIKIGKEIGNTVWIEKGNLATTYTLADQRPNGSFDYNGPPEKPQNFFDNYHTGFVLRMLHSIWKLTGREDVKFSLDKCYDHYIRNFFEESGLPKLMPNRKYRIDIHSAAEAVNCLSQLSRTYQGSIDIAKKVLIWTIDNLQDSSGFFYYGILKSRILGISYKSKIPYIRWGQAWMLKAISTYLKNQDFSDNA